MPGNEPAGRISLGYARIAYLLFLGTTGYTICFLASAGLPKSIDRGATHPEAPVIVFWAAPVLTAGHLLFALASTGYILIGIAFEERDLRDELGGGYAAYRATCLR